MIPDEIQGTNSKLVFLYLKQKNEKTGVDEIADDLNLRRLTIIPVMRRLCNSGYIDRLDGLSYEICDDLDD